MNIRGFATNFPDARPPEALAQLWKAGHNENFSLPDGLELYDGDGNSGIEAGWTNDPAALGRLFGFAQANHRGSFYALWRASEGQGVDEMPVVLFGDEGGQLIVATNAHEWIALLTTNIAPTIETNWDTDEDVVSFAPEGEDDDGCAKQVAAFQQWITDQFGHEPISTAQAEMRVKQAQDQYQENFDSWLAPFLP